VFGTSDGGNTWTHLDTFPRSEVLSAIHFIDRHTGWIAGYGFASFQSHIFHTTDGGNSWDYQLETEEMVLFKDIYFTDAEHGWALGWKGEIYAYRVP
jgi:photosystem II stability/assembly factor-like uncharacterized protein